MTTATFQSQTTDKSVEPVDSPATPGTTDEIGKAIANGQMETTDSVIAGLATDQLVSEPFVPTDAPFTTSQRQWLNGLLTGLSVLARSAVSGNESSNTAAAAPAVPLTILFGSQSGTCESLSKDIRKYARTLNFDPAIKELNAISANELAELDRALVLCSTFGEGDPPDNAMSFFDQIMADDAPLLDKLSYSVLGLGDSSYTYFNKAARDLDERFEQLGATRVADFVACDVAYEDDFETWKQAVFATDTFKGEADATGSDTASLGSSADETDEPADRYTKNEPFSATILEVKNLSGEASAKEVNHVEISLAGSDLDYAVGDALGLWPTNCPELVDEILSATGLSGKETIALKSEKLSLRAALLDQLDLCTATPNTIDTLGIQFDESEHGPLNEQHVIDLIESHVQQIQQTSVQRPVFAAQQLVDALRALQPRLYSIASSPNAHPGEVHLTVGAVRYATHGKQRKGVASTFLADRCLCGAKVNVYLQRSAHFHLPETDDIPLIMIGPGTGIAPFRAFLEERATHESHGRNWLFFGDQHEADDFLYRQEIESWLKQGMLERFDAAWSRDQAEKIYVQHRMLDAGAEIWNWLQDGAAIYVCGDASRMAKDVDDAIHQIIAEHGTMSSEQASEYVEQLKSSHRYQRDVY